MTMSKHEPRVELTAEEHAAQRKRPSLRALIASGEVDPDSVTTVGDHQDFQEMILGLKEERKRLNLSLKDVVERMGSKADVPALSRLENGENDNPTINTVARYARALGKRIKWAFEDVPRGPCS